MRACVRACVFWFSAVTYSRLLSSCHHPSSISRQPTKTNQPPTNTPTHQPTTTTQQQRNGLPPLSRSLPPSLPPFLPPATEDSCAVSWHTTVTLAQLQLVQNFVGRRDSVIIHWQPVVRWRKGTGRPFLLLLVVVVVGGKLMMTVGAHQPPTNKPAPNHPNCQRIRTESRRPTKFCTNCTSTRQCVPNCSTGFTWSSGEMERWRRGEMDGGVHCYTATIAERLPKTPAKE